MSGGCLALVAALCLPNGTQVPCPIICHQDVYLVGGAKYVDVAPHYGEIYAKLSSLDLAELLKRQWSFVERLHFMINSSAHVDSAIEWRQDKVKIVIGRAKAHPAIRLKLHSRGLAAVGNVGPDQDRLAHGHFFNFARFEYDIGSQPTPSCQSGLPERPKQESCASNSHPNGNQRPLGRIAGGVRSLPLGAKIAVSSVLAFLAAPVLFRALDGQGDGWGRWGRRLRDCLLGGGLVLASFLFWRLFV
ncbi:MAG: hypothetical protein ACK5SX_03885 [Sandaracinobacter sp.]